VTRAASPILAGLVLGFAILAVAVTAPWWVVPR
jgi:hypothetical protein